MSQNKWLILASLYLDSGTEYFSSVRVTHPDYLYEGYALSWGSIDRTVPLVSGLPEVSDAKIRLADTNRHWRDLLYRQTPRRRLIDIKLVEEGESVSAGQLLFTGEVKDAQFGAGYVELTLKDRMFSWLDEPIPAMLIRELYPDLPAENEGGFLNIIQGEMRSVGSQQSPPTENSGVIPCPHYGVIGSPPTADRYGLAMHPVANVVAVYRNNGSTWEVVDASEYEITEVEITAFNVDMTHTFIDFHANQNDAEIRADVDGIDFRGPWGSLPEEGHTSPPAALRNPIDFFIGVTYFILNKAGVSTTVFDTVEIAALREAFEIGFGSPPVVYLCDGAVTEPITAREFLGRFLPSFNLLMFQNISGLIALRFIDEENVSRPVFSEGKYINFGTFTESLPATIANQIVYRYDFNPVRNEFEAWGIYNTYEQYVLGLSNLSPPEDKVEKEEIQLHFIRDLDTALDVITRRAEFMALGSFQQEFEIPMPPTMADVELAAQVGITHSQGLAEGGYINREVVIFGITAYLDELKFRLRTVLREPQSMVTCQQPTIAEATLDIVDTCYVENPENAIDGQFGTKCRIRLLRTSALASYAAPIIHGFPAPESGRTWDTATISILTEFSAADGSPGGVPVGFARVCTTNPGSNPFASGITPSSQTGDFNGFTGTEDRARGYSYFTIDSADWPGEDNLFVQFMIWGSTLQVGPWDPEAFYDIEDVCITYNYTD